jgi:anti-anti-sigma factor
MSSNVQPQDPPLEPFDIDVVHRDGVVVVRPKGELDLASAPELRKILDELCRQKANVLLELDELTFIDSTGVRLIWDIDAKSRQDGMSLQLTTGPPDVMRVFDLTGLTARLPFRDAG